MKKLAIHALLTCSITAAASAQSTFNIDLNTLDGDAGTGWNVYTTPADVDGGTNWFGFDVLKSDGSAETASGWDTNDTQSQNFHINDDGYDNGRYMNMSEVTMTGTTLQVRATETTLDDAYIGINAMRLTVIPEPNSYALLTGLLGMSFVMLRRR